MSLISNSGERINLSPFDNKVLVTLLFGIHTGYEIARQIEVDFQDGNSVSHGTLYPALKRLLVLEFIATSNENCYEITQMGRDMLSIELNRWKKIIKKFEDMR